MVLILSDKENKIDRQIIEILSRKGAAVITDNKISESFSHFTAISIHNKTKIECNTGIAIVTDSIKGLKNQESNNSLTAR